MTIVQARLAEARRDGAAVCVPVGVVARAWRGPRQARLARLIKSPDLDVAIMTLSLARAVGSSGVSTDHTDVVDVHVALCARRRGYAVVTSDPDDIARIDPTLPLMHA